MCVLRQTYVFCDRFPAFFDVCHACYDRRRRSITPQNGKMDGVLDMLDIAPKLPLSIQLAIPQPL